MPLSQNGECSSGNTPTYLVAGRGFESPCVRYFLEKKGGGRMQVHLDRVGHAAPLVHRHVLRLRPASGTASPRLRGWDPMVGPHRHVLVGPAGVTTAPRPRGGTRAKRSMTI